MIFLSTMALKLPFHFYEFKRLYIFIYVSVCWPSFSTFTWNFYSLCPIIPVLSNLDSNSSSFSSVLGFVSLLLRGTRDSSTRLLYHNHQVLFYCCNTHVQMGTCRTTPSFSFYSQVVPLHFLVRNCGQCCSCAILKAVKNQLPAFHFLPYTC